MEQVPVNSPIGKVSSVLSNKRTKSVLFLILTALLILFINSLLPLVSGQAHYTAESINISYGRYQEMKKKDNLYDLTYSSKIKIDNYINEYKAKHKDLPLDKLALVDYPKDAEVSVYTKFFFQSYWWYIDVFLNLISAVFLYFSTFNYFILRAKDKRLEYLNGEYVMKQLNERYLDPDTFEPWLENDFNNVRKRKQHIRNVHYALKKLENKYPFAIKKKYKAYFESFNGSDEILVPVPYKAQSRKELKQNKKEQKYVTAKEELLTQLSDKYIDEYVLHANVKQFKTINASFVYTGINNNTLLQDEYSVIKTDKEKIKSTIISKIIFSLAITLSFSSLLTVLAVNLTTQSPLLIVITILTKLLPLSLQIYYAINYTNTFMETQLLPNLKYRENIAMSYLAEMKRQGKQNESIVINHIYLKENYREERGTN